MRGSEIDIVQEGPKRAARSYRTEQIHQIVSYMGFRVREREKGNEAVRCICVVKWSPNITYLHVTVSGVHASTISIASVPSQLLLLWFESSFWLYSCFQLWAPMWGFTDCSISIILGVICWFLQHLIMPDVEMWRLSSFFFLNQYVFWFNKPVVQTGRSTGATTL